MADPPAEKLDDQIARLEAVVSEILTCASCGKSLELERAECPHCGAIVGEKIELAKKSVTALVEVPKPVEPSKEPPREIAPAPSPPVESPKPPTEVAPAAEVAAKAEPVPEPKAKPKPEPKPEPIQEPEPEPKPAPEAPAPPAAESKPEPEGTPEPIGEPKPEEETEPIPEAVAEEEPEVQEEVPAEEEIEAAPIPRAKRSPAARIEVVSRDIGQPSSFRRPAVIASGMALYLVGLVAVLPLLGKYVSVVVMILASAIVAAGVILRGPEAPRRAARETRGKEEYVCPLCGTEVARGATECGTCGAQFES